MFGLGRPRTSLGSFIDKKKIAQVQLEQGAKLSRPTVNKLTNDKSYEPTATTRGKVIKFLIKQGHDVDHDDFW